MKKILIIIVFISLIIYFPKLSRASNWLNASWGYRKSIIINNTQNSNDLLDYQIFINVTHDSYMQEDFDDLRFVYYNFSNQKETEIPYWIENSVNEAYANIWIKVTEIPKNDYAIVYMYYGNPDVETTSSGVNTFVWFDDASSDKSSSYNHVLGPSSLSWESTDKRYIVSTGTENIWLIKNIDIKDIELRCSFMFSSVSSSFDNNQFGFVTRYSDNDNYYIFREETRPEPDQLDIIRQLNGIGIEIKHTNLTSNFLFDTWYEHIGLVYKDKLVSKSKTKNQNVTTIDANLTGNSIGFWTYRDSGMTYFKDLRVRKYVEPEPTVSLGPEESYPSKLSIFLSTHKHIFINETAPIITTINYNGTPLPGLNESNFNLFLENESLNIDDILDYDNGTYVLETKISSNTLGSRTLQLQVNYEDETTENTTKIILLTEPQEKILIITNPEWENYIPAVTIKKPVLVYDSNRKYIDYFISQYKPDQIFQLGSSLTFPIETFIVDSADTLMKIFYNKTDLVIPLDKEVAIASTMLSIPILIDPTEETIEFFNPNNTYNISSIGEVEDIFILRNPRPDYFILANKEDDNSIFASVLAIKKNGFIILADGSADEFKDELIDKLNLFKLPDSYQFDQNLYLILIGTPHFSVEDPVVEMHNDDGSEILTDSIYADVNDDEFLDLSLGRMKGSTEQMSYQIELSQILEQKKRALILSAYNTPGKYWGVIFSGGGMPAFIPTELELRKKDFNVTRLVEKRSEYDELNFTILEELNDIAKKLKALSEATYDSFFSEMLGDISQIFLIARAGTLVICPLYEFDWGDTWQSIITLELRLPRRLPILNITNLMKHVPKNQVIVYYSKGNATHWLIPENSTNWETYYWDFDPLQIPFDSSFYYLRHSFGYNISSKLLDNGTIASIGPTANSYSLQSDRVAVEFFKNFDQPIGKALKLTKNRNLKLDRFINLSTRVYKKEYYTETLLGEPSLIFDPHLDLKSSKFVKCKHDIFTHAFFVEPEYFLASNNDENFLIFEDPDDYLIAENKPAIPLYKESFILPVESEVLDVSVKVLSEEVFDDIFIPVVIPDPDYFDNETFVGTFLEQFYWTTSSMLLDGRKTLDLFFSPVVYSSNGTAKVFEKIKVTINYKTPFEISEVFAMNTYKNKKAIIFFAVCNGLYEKIKVNSTIRIQTDSFEDVLEKQFTLHPGLNLNMLKYENTSHVGDYSVSIVVRHEDIIAGPKHTYFKVGDEPWSWAWGHYKD